MADAEHVAADAVATPEAPAPAPEPAIAAQEPAATDAPPSAVAAAPTESPVEEAKPEGSPEEQAVVAVVQPSEAVSSAAAAPQPDQAEPVADAKVAASAEASKLAAGDDAAATASEASTAQGEASAAVPDAEAAEAPQAPSTPAPAALGVSLSADMANAEDDLSAELAGASTSALRRSPSGKRLSSPASPTASPSVAEHGFTRKADVTRIPSQGQQPEEGGGIRMWVTRAEEWPPQARRARALLRETEDADEALALAKQRDCPPGELEALDAAAKSAKEASPDPDSIDWRSPNYAAFSLAEQLAAVQGVAEREHSPAVAAEGWLSRVKAKEKTVKARYFVLTPRALVYFASAAHARVSSSGYLLAEWDFPNLPGRFTMRTHGARIWLRDVTGIRLDVAGRSLALSRPATEGGEVVLQAATEEECREWCDAIEELRSADEDGPAHDDEGGADCSAAEGGAGAAASAAGAAADGTRRASTGGKDADNAPPATPEGAGGRTRRPTLLGRMFGRTPKAELSEEEKAKAEEEKAKADAERKAKADAERHARHERTEAAEEERARKAEERRQANAEAARQREVDRKKAAILAKQHHTEEAKRRAEMGLEAVLKLKAETEARFRPRYWRAPKPGPDASEEEISMTPTLHTVVEDRFRSYLEDRDGNPLALMSGWLTKDAESAVSMGVPKDRFFVLTPYFIAYFCSEADAGISATGHMTGRAMGEKPRRLMRLGARIGLEHIVNIRANTEDDETDDVLGDLDTGAVLAAERGDEQAAEAIAREAKARQRAARSARAGAGADGDDGDAKGKGGAAAAATEAAAAAAGSPLKKGKGRASISGKRYSSLMASTNIAGGASPSTAGRPDRGDSLSGTKLEDGRCITPPKPRTKPPAPEMPPPGLAAKVMIATTRARLGSDPMAAGAMPRVESATLSADLVDRALRLQCHKVAYRDEWVRMLKVWQLWWRKRQEQLTLEQWSSAAAFRHSQAAMSMTKEQAMARRTSTSAGGAQARKGGGRRFVGGRGRGLPAK